MKKLLLSSILSLSGMSLFAQSSCANAVNITTNGTLTCATITGTYNSPCLGGTTNDAGTAMKAMWYKYTPTSNGEVTLSSNLPINTGTTYSNDTRVSVLKGASCTALSCVDSSDDVSSTNYLTTITVPVAAGTTYYFEWDNYWLNKGFQFTFNFTSVSCVRPGTNDFYLPDTYTTSSTNLYWNNAVGSPANYDVDWSTTFATAAGSGTIVPITAGATTYTQGAISNLPASSNFRYYVRSNCGGTQSAWQGPKFGYLAVPLPYTNDFEDVAKNYTDGFIGFSRLSTSDTSTPPSYADGGNGISMYTFNSTTAVANRWAYSRAISLTAGEQVTVNFKTRLYTPSTTDPVDPMNLDLTVGTAQSATAQAEIITSIVETDDTQYNQQTGTWTAPADGIYFFGFHNNSDIGVNTAGTFLFFDTLEISSVLSNTTFSEANLLVFPNPTKNVVNVSYKNGTFNNIVLSDLNGRTVKSITLDNVSSTQINISDLSQGVYMMKINSDNGSVTKKLVKE